MCVEKDLVTAIQVTSGLYNNIILLVLMYYATYACYYHYENDIQINYEIKDSYE